MGDTEIYNTLYYYTYNLTMRIGKAKVEELPSLQGGADVVTCELVRQVSVCGPVGVEVDG